MKAETVSNITKNKKEILVTAVGDCTLGSDINFGYEFTLPATIDANHDDLAYVFRGVQHITAADDLTIANMEGTFTTSDQRYPKTYAFKGPPNYAKIFKLGSVEAVNVSNNHIYDYYEQGFKDTVKALENAGVLWFGEGTARIVTAKGVKVGLLGYAFRVDGAQIVKDIAALKKVTDIVIVSFHGGEESSYWPNAEQKKFAHLSIDSGADMVIEHHPHVLQGLEIYKNRLIAYSLGNFAFGGNMNPVDKRTMLLQAKFTINDKGVNAIEAKIIPARISSVNWINDYQPTVLEGQEKQSFLEWFQTLCTGIHLDEEEIRVL